MTDQIKTPASVPATALSVVAGSVITPEELQRRRESNRRFAQWAIYSDGWECPRCAEHHDPGCGNCDCGYSRR